MPVSRDISCRDCCVSHLCLGKDLDVADLDRVDSLIKNIKKISKKQHIYQMNSPASYLYALYQGSCKEYWIDDKGNECVTNFYFPGDIIGIESVLRKEYLFYTVALEEMELCMIPIENFLELMGKSTEILKRFLTITGQKMQHDQNNCTGITANEKVADFLLNIASRMYERNSQKKEICLTMSQVDIANFLGIAPETINRVFNTLKRKNIIKLKNKTVEIVSISELQKLGRMVYFDPDKIL